MHEFTVFSATMRRSHDKDVVLGHLLVASTEAAMLIRPMKMSYMSGAGFWVSLYTRIQSNKLVTMAPVE